MQTSGALPVDVLQYIALLSNLPTFRSICTLNRAVHERLCSTVVQEQAKQRFAQEEVVENVCKTLRATYLTLPNGWRHGLEQVVVISDNLCIYTCEWQDGQRHGWEQWFSQAGALTCAAEWCQGVRLRDVAYSIPGTFEFDSFQEVRYVENNHEHGIHTGIDKERLLARDCYVRGEEHGCDEAWNRAGTQTYAAEWVLGCLHGVVHCWDERGECLLTQIWEHGRHVS